MIRRCLPLLGWIAIDVIICLMPGPDVWVERLAAEPPVVEVPSDESLSESGAGQEQGRPVPGAPSFEKITQEPAAPAFKVDKTSTKNHALSTLLTENVKTKERLGHIVPMIGIGFCLVQLSRARKMVAWKIIGIAVLFAGGVALSIEFCQALLPEGFHRGFAWDDIGVSLLGGLVGSVAGMLATKSTRGHDNTVLD